MVLFSRNGSACVPGEANQQTNNLLQPEQQKFCKEKPYPINQGLPTAFLPKVTGTLSGYELQEEHPVVVDISRKVPVFPFLQGPNSTINKSTTG